MNQKLKMSDYVQKAICEYFDGDSQDHLYGYRTWTQLDDMFTNRFGNFETFPHSSRWTICCAAINHMYEINRINDFFSIMLSIKNIKKEHPGVSDVEIATLRKQGISYINEQLVKDDLELLERGDMVILHQIEDKNDLIGSGGFANVFIIPGTDMVEKKLKDEFKSDKGIVSRFKNEFYLITEKLQGLDGIIQGYEFDADTISYTMEYCNCDLKCYIQKTELETMQQVNLVLEILDIMKNVHERNVLHRDLSPKNIFMKNGHPVIADFGLGKAIDENGRTFVTIDTSCNGTLEYCDPRQFQGLGFADVQSDIYSLGRLINYVMTKNSDDFKHQLSVVSTISTETSLDARYHSVSEMIDNIKHITKNLQDASYVERCEKIIESREYNTDIDDYLLSFEEDALINKLNEWNFRNAYKILFLNRSYEQPLIRKLTALEQIFSNPIGHTFKLFDDVAYLCIDIMKEMKDVSPSVKTVMSRCIYAIAIGVNRYNAQNYFEQNYNLLEKDYVYQIMEELKKKR